VLTFLSALLLLIGSCTFERGKGDDGGVTPPVPREGDEVLLTVRTPGEFSTKALTALQETTIGTKVDVIVFDHTTGLFSYRVEGEVKDEELSDLPGIASTAKIKAKLVIKDTPVDIWVAANAGTKLTDNNIPWHAAGDLTKEAIASVLTFDDESGVTQRGSSAVPIPMWSSINNVLVEATATGGKLVDASSTPKQDYNKSLTLLRMIARIDVAVDPSATGVELKSVWLYKYSTKGTLFPSHGEGVLKFDNGVLVGVNLPSIPNVGWGTTGVNDILQVAELDEDNPDLSDIKGNKVEGVIYTFESDIKGANGWSNETCIVLELSGGKAGASSFYRVDFIKKESSGNEKVDILRNHKYGVTVTAVGAAGAGSAIDAAKSPSQNIEAQVKDWDIVNLGNAAYDGINVLSVSETNITIPAQGTEGFPLEIYTDYEAPAGSVVPGDHTGWDANVLSNGAFKVHLGTDAAAYSATYNSIGKVTLNVVVPPNTTDPARELYDTIKVKAGKMEVKVALVQASEADLSISIIPKRLQFGKSAPYHQTARISTTSGGAVTLAPVGSPAITLNAEFPFADGSSLLTVSNLSEPVKFWPLSKTTAGTSEGKYVATVTETYGGVSFSATDTITIEQLDKDISFTVNGLVDPYPATIVDETRPDGKAWEVLDVYAASRWWLEKAVDVENFLTIASGYTRPGKAGGKPIEDAIYTLTNNLGYDSRYAVITVKSDDPTWVDTSLTITQSGTRAFVSPDRVNEVELVRASSADKSVPRSALLDITSNTKWKYTYDESGKGIVGTTAVALDQTSLTGIYAGALLTHSLTDSTVTTDKTWSGGKVVDARAKYTTRLTLTEDVSQETAVAGSDVKGLLLLTPIHPVTGAGDPVVVTVKRKAAARLDLLSIKRGSDDMLSKSVLPKGSQTYLDIKVGSNTAWILEVKDDEGKMLFTKTYAEGDYASVTESEVNVTNGDWAREICVIARTADGSITHVRWLKQHGQKTEGTIQETDKLLIIQKREIDRGGTILPLGVSDALNPFGDAVKLTFKARELQAATVKVKMYGLLENGDQSSWSNRKPIVYSIKWKSAEMEKELSFPADDNLSIPAGSNTTWETLRLSFDASVVVGSGVFFEKAGLPLHAQNIMFTSPSSYYDYLNDGMVITGDVINQSPAAFVGTPVEKVSALGGLISVTGVSTNLSQYELALFDAVDASADVSGTMTHPVKNTTFSYPTYGNGVARVWAKPNTTDNSRTLTLKVRYRDGDVVGDYETVGTITQGAVKDEFRYTSWRDDHFRPGIWVIGFDMHYTSSYRWKCVYADGEFLTGAGNSLTEATKTLYPVDWEFLDYNYDALQLINGVNSGTFITTFVERLPLSSNNHFGDMQTYGGRYYLPADGPLVGLNMFAGGSTVPATMSPDPYAIVGQRAYIGSQSTNASNTDWNVLEDAASTERKIVAMNYDYTLGESPALWAVYPPEAPKRGGLYKLKKGSYWGNSYLTLLVGPPDFNHIAPAVVNDITTFAESDQILYTQILHGTILILKKTDAPQPVFPPEIINRPSTKLPE
jgi:hypothetical protein